MFGIGMPEMILILAVALIVVGPKRLPELAKSMGRAMGEFKRATSSLKKSMNIEEEIKKNSTSYGKNKASTSESFKKNITNNKKEEPSKEE